MAGKRRSTAKGRDSSAHVGHTGALAPEVAVRSGPFEGGPSAATTPPPAGGRLHRERDAPPAAANCGRRRPGPREAAAVGYLRRSTDRQEQSIPDQQKAV